MGRKGVYCKKRMEQMKQIKEINKIKEGNTGCKS